MKRLNFYDVKSKKKFFATKYKKKVKTVNGRRRYFAVAKAPSGIDAWRVISKEDYMSK